MESGLPSHDTQNAFTAPDYDSQNRLWGIFLGTGATVGGAYLVHTQKSQDMGTRAQTGATDKTAQPKHDPILSAYMLEGLGITLLGIAAIQEIVRVWRGPKAS